MKKYLPPIRELLSLAPAALLAVCGAALVFYSTRPYGAGVSTDSVSYLAAARSWMAGRGVMDYNGSPLNVWPPLYPLVLGTGGFIFSRDPLTLADLFNALVFGLTIFMAGLYFRRALPNKPLFAFFGTAAVLFSAPLFFVVQWAWSEPLFNLLLVLSMLLMEVYLAGRNTWVLPALAACAGLAALTRYLGVTVILWGGLVLFFTGKSWIGRLKGSALFLAAAGAFPAGWMLRNYLLTGFPMGPRSASAYTLSKASGMGWEVLRSWFIPKSFHWQGTGLVVALVLLVGLAWFSRRDLRRAGRAVAAGSWRAVLYLAAFIGFMAVSIFYSAPDIDSRMVSPMYFPLVIVSTFLLAELSAPLYTLKPTWLAPVFFSAFFTGWAALVVFGSMLGLVRASHDFGGSLNGSVWRGSALVAAVKSANLDSQCRVYTNYPAGLFFLTGIQSSRSLDSQGYSDLRQQKQNGAANAIWPPEGKACLVWINGRNNRSLLDIKALKDAADFEVVYKDKSGGIYRLTAK
jgi:hypothetical protein